MEVPIEQRWKHLICEPHGSLGSWMKGEAVSSEFTWIWYFCYFWFVHLFHIRYIDSEDDMFLALAQFLILGCCLMIMAFLSLHQDCCTKTCAKYGCSEGWAKNDAVSYFVPYSEHGLGGEIAIFIYALHWGTLIDSRRHESGWAQMVV